MVLADHHINIKNFKRQNNEFVKCIPTRQKGRYMQVFKSTKHYQKALKRLKRDIIALQLFLLSIFGVISYFLAKSALKPLQEGIETLDKFAKDLIHDLNTPVASMKLNLTLLQKNSECNRTKAFERLKKSVDTVTELQRSLTVLLEKETFQLTKTDLCQIVEDVIEIQRTTYKNVEFANECFEFTAYTNPQALKQILQNLISNGAKHNKNEKPQVRVCASKGKLYIEDNGGGIEDPQKIFQRNYSQNQSSGLGLDIVKRLCDATKIGIGVERTGEGSRFWIEF